VNNGVAEIIRKIALFSLQSAKDSATIRADETNKDDQPRDKYGQFAEVNSSGSKSESDSKKDKALSKKEKTKYAPSPRRSREGITVSKKHTDFYAGYSIPAIQMRRRKME
jgi:hypothetical protein